MKSKIDLIWIIPFFLGCIGIIISSIVFLKLVAIETLEYDLWLGIFQLGVMLVVLDKGLVYLNHVFKEFAKPSQKTGESK